MISFTLFSRLRLTLCPFEEEVKFGYGSGGDRGVDFDTESRLRTQRGSGPNASSRPTSRIEEVGILCDHHGEKVLKHLLRLGG